MSSMTSYDVSVPKVRLRAPLAKPAAGPARLEPVVLPLSILDLHLTFLKITSAPETTFLPCLPNQPLYRSLTTTSNAKS